MLSCFAFPAAKKSGAAILPDCATFYVIIVNKVFFERFIHYSFIYLWGNKMDKIKFKQACSKILNEERQKSGIGTLGEKTMHAILKHYFDEDTYNHEIKIGGFVADILKKNVDNTPSIIEIQTRQFDKLRKKLDAFLKVCPVTVVYPIARTKWLSWIDFRTGEVAAKRKSPKVGKPYEIFVELYRIKHLLTNKNLKICIIMLDIEEYRYLNGWSRDKKRGSSRSDRIPTEIIEEIYINDKLEYNKLIPNELKELFTSKDFKKASGLSLSASQTALNVLNSVGSVERIGKQGNLYIYKKMKNE